MKPLTTWEGVKKGDQFIVLEVSRGLMNMEVGDRVRVVKENHTGFAMQIVRPDEPRTSRSHDGYIYYPHMVAPYVNIETNEDALSLLEED